MVRTPNALEQSPHDPTRGSARAGNHVDYRQIIPGSGTSTCQPLDAKTCISKVAWIEPQAKSGEEIADITASHPWLHDKDPHADIHRQAPDPSRNPLPSPRRPEE